MDLVYASLDRRPAVAAPDPATEAAEAVQALLAHSTLADGLEHATALPSPSRLDLLLYLLTPGAESLRPEGSGGRDNQAAAHRATHLLARCHAASPLLRHRYLPPVPFPDHRAPPGLDSSPE
ncbi:hypothetical protein CFP65_3894 [Kitasatospora sp. MMS16-BH015]|uniref:hypothetical protein n=1 Tax=Kitasatospora sp. MMS16-BH015 TaxID=2018025 RepID=UPI000CA28EAF|nr:hypothetical protein [Kitasatospora sp. MMS16-BH015]AUG78668.1 hypothetical protein CFP65_3894 [Kitasatospora sp. MMS16-BH015]